MNNQHNQTPKNSSTHLQNGHNLNTPVETVNPDAVSYEEGYLHGRASERSLESQEQEVRSEHSAARGLLLGMALTSLVGLTVGAIFYLNQREESPTPTPVLVPARPAPQQPNRETTIIERTTEKIQPSAPINQEPPANPAPQQNQPDIRIIVPNSGQPSAPSPQNTTPQTAPQTAPTQSQSQPLSPNPPSSQPNTSRSTPTTTQPNTTNQASPAPSQNQIPTVTTPTEPTDTTNQSLSEPTPNQTQPDSSNSNE
jgi:hypothetical protein